MKQLRSRLGKDSAYDLPFELGDILFLVAKLSAGPQIAGEYARRVERVLDVRQGELCWVAGTIYMEMPLKPNVLDDLTKDVGYSGLMSYRPVLIPSRISQQHPLLAEPTKTQHTQS